MNIRLWLRERKEKQLEEIYMNEYSWAAGILLKNNNNTIEVECKVELALTNFTFSEFDFGAQDALDDYKKLNINKIGINSE